MPARSAQYRVVALAAALALLTLPGVLLPAAPAVDVTGVTWWVLLLAFVVAEAGDVRLTIGGQVESVSLSEVPLVIGLLVLAPVETVAARVLGGLLVFLVVRRQTGVKVAFNTALVGAGTSVALLAFHLLAGPAPEPGGRTWASVLVAVTVAGSVDAVAMALIERWFGSGDRPADAWRRRRRQFALAVIVPPIVGAGGVVVALAAGAGGALVPLAVVGIALWAGYRAFAVLLDRHSSLERLYTLSEELASATQESGGVTAALLARSADLMRCDVAVLVLRTGPGQARSWTVTAGADGVVEQPEDPARTAAWSRLGRSAVLRGRDEAERALLTRLGLSEALVVPVTVDAGIDGVLLAGARPGPRGRFTAEDGRLLEIVANHGSVALRTSHLLTRLHADANTDELTGLPNRKALRRALDAAASRAAEKGPGCAAMVLDFDGFKAVNDTLGHQAGDELLRVIAARLVEAAGADAVVARLGGDEFACLSTTCGTATRAAELAERLLTAFDAPVDVGGSRLRVGGSLGVALGPWDGDTGSELLRNADIAMYAAKRGAGASYRIYTAELDDGSAELLTLSGDLRDALARDDIAVVLQPIVDLETGRVHSLEALARWTHHELGPVSPETFFLAAERSGLITALSGRILDEALRLAHAWHAAGTPVRVAVNLAPRWLADPSLPEQIGRALAHHGVAPSLLCLEITEGSVIKDPQRAISTLERLRALGVHLAVDDFGTGYSSLTYLTRLPVDQLKIDKSFVQRIEEGHRDRVIVRSILDLARNLGIEAVAEGVTDAGTHRALQEMGCRLGQGYLWARPMAPDDVPAVLRDLGVVEVPVDGAPPRGLPAQRLSWEAWAAHSGASALPYASSGERRHPERA